MLLSITIPVYKEKDTIKEDDKERFFGRYSKRDYGG